MPPKKRTAEADNEGSSPRATKSAKTSKAATASSKESASKSKASPKQTKEKAKPAPKKPAMSAETFKSSALPLHVHFTHTPPNIASPSKGSSEPNKKMDDGHVGSITMMPAVFSTGSHGWKGSKPISIEMTDSETGKKVKVQVQISVNAVVKGSKAENEEKKDKEEEEAVEAAMSPADEDEEDE